jgi:amino acid permease
MSRKLSASERRGDDVTEPDAKPAAATRSRRHVVPAVIAVKVVIIALVVLLPSGVAIGLGAAHAVAAAVVVVAVASILLVRRHRNARAMRTAATNHDTTSAS